ncbi:glycosyl hydrolase 76 family protein [Mycobacterium xenopi 4042]|uniref:Glycosyl hydrolase 76 family protein n=1 Tax=Mycobacterium xenopi 4042 TaxID=1299334 RepID=X8DLM7_MYCXE|nr:glycosyl hydrolase 76 family protein [Mycobacterium xenopi 4042]
MADWIDATLIDPETHLVFDGIKGGSLVRAQYTYCQGVVLGLETELAARTGDPRHAPRVHRLVAAVNEHMAPGGVIKGAGGGDGGLFAGITARYLALVATTLPGTAAEDVTAGIPRARWCWPRRPRRGTTVRRSTGCPCSVRFGIAPPNCPPWPASRRNSSRAPSPARRPPNGISPCSCPGGCSWRPPIALRSATMQSAERDEEERANRATVGDDAERAAR